MMICATVVNSLLKKSVTSLGFNCNISYSHRNLNVLKWDLVSAVCLERKPVVTSPLTPVETKYKKLLLDLEYENSLKSDHELRNEFDKKQAELLSRGELTERDVEQTMKQTAQDFEDACQEELAQFQLAERITEADKKSDTKSVQRKLNEHLVLVLQQKIGKDMYWLLPQGIRCEGETMRQAAERVLIENCGRDLKCLFLGNAPCGFYKYHYPKHVRSEDGPVGAKVFFFKAWYRAGSVQENKSLVNNYQWLCRKELYSALHNDYSKSVSQFLVDE